MGAIFDWQQSGANDSTRVTGYLQRYGVQLFHNFTYFLNDPINGDQFEQFENRYPNPWVAVDVDLAFSHARFPNVPDDEAFVPGALNRVISGGIAVNPPESVRTGPFAGFRLRHFGPRPLIEDASVTSNSTSIFNGEAGYKFSERIRLTLEGFNLLDAEVSDIDYFFESRLRDEPAPVEDIHFHAAIPRSARLSLQVSF